MALTEQNVSKKMDKNPPRNAKEELRKSSGDHGTQA